MAAPLCAALAALLAWKLHIDPLTAWLAMNPGGTDPAALIAASTNVDAPFVIAMQMMRFVVVMFVLPPVARRLMRDAPDARRSHIGTPNDIHNRR